VTAGAGALLCPVCVRATRDGACPRHGRWRRHQLLTPLDRERALRRASQPFRPHGRACPRCLGRVVSGRAGYDCVEHALAGDRHGPFRDEELLGPPLQREAARRRALIARTERARRTGVAARALPEAAWAARMLASAALVAATLAYLLR
jgi:hypothetical protein